MAEAFLQILLDNLTSFIQGELRLFFGFKDEFENLKSTFTTIQAVLEDAQEKQLKDKPLENWLHKLNVAAYEVDDILDECKSKAARLSQTKYGCYHPKIIPFRYKIGKRMKEMMEKLDAIAAERSKFHLVEKHAFENQEKINPNLVAIGKEIVKKSGGVPLAAKTLGGLLRFEEQEREWEHIRDSEIWNLPQDESFVLPALRLSYHHLPLDLRQCFAYCAVFPKDTEMEKENLISFWMAHGFLLSKGNLELEDVGNEVWNELYLRSFFQEIEVKMLSNLRDLTSLSGCKNCSCLLPFGELPCLKTLMLWSGSAEVEYVDSGFPTGRRFPSLRKLIIGKFYNLKGLLKKEGEEQFPVLEEMTLSSVKKFEFVGEADAIVLRSISNLKDLTSLNIRFNNEATSLPEEMVKSLAVTSDNLK